MVKSHDSEFFICIKTYLLCLQKVNNFHLKRGLLFKRLYNK